MAIYIPYTCLNRSCSNPHLTCRECPCNPDEAGVLDLCAFYNPKFRYSLIRQLILFGRKEK